MNTAAAAGIRSRVNKQRKRESLVLSLVAPTTTYLYLVNTQTYTHTYAQQFNQTHFRVVDRCRCSERASNSEYDQLCKHASMYVCQLKQQQHEAPIRRCIERRVSDGWSP